MTAKEIADACDTVPSAVNRMCKAVGFNGFSRFKISLTAIVGNDKSNVWNMAFNKDDTVQEVFNSDCLYMRIVFFGNAAWLKYNSYSECLW